jgi:hypothetical protein
MMKEKKSSSAASHEIRSVNSGASIDAPFYPQPDAAKPPESKGSSTASALRHFIGE